MSFAFETKGFDKVFVKLLDQLRTLIMFDGFDELNFNIQKRFIKQLNKLSNQLTHSKIILTSRPASLYQNLERFEVFELSRLNKNQVALYSSKWMSRERTMKFMKELESGPFIDIATNPLLLSILLSTYESHLRLPDKPRNFYRMSVSVFLSDWDRQRSVVRKSRFGSFPVHIKQEFLAHLTFQLALDCPNKLIYRRDELLKTLEKTLVRFDLPLDESQKVLEEIQSHTGILRQDGYDQYSFVYLSLQEYFIASYMMIFGPKRLDPDFVLNKPNVIAVATSLAANCTDYFISVILNNRPVLTARFIEILFDRLSIENPDFQVTATLGFVCLDLLSHHAFIEGKTNSRLINNLHNIIKKSIREYINHASYLKESLNPQTRNKLHSSYELDELRIILNEAPDDEIMILKSDLKYEKDVKLESPQLIFVNHILMSKFK